MKLTTDVHIAPPPFSIGYRQPQMMLGSCFALNIGERLQKLKFPLLLNPFGVLYNPASVALSLDSLVEKKQLTESDLHLGKGLWFSYSHHSSFSSPSKDEALQNINASLRQASEYIHRLDTLIITLGTARVYTRKEDGQVVANCHKTPASEFTHSLLSVDDTVDYLYKSIARLQALRPSLKVVLTVSPIRHTKDGAHANQLSKATLLLAVEQLCGMLPHTYYFPSYELMMDELRDYRFYADDMLHPSPLAIEYIWQKFSHALLDDEAKAIVPEVEKVVKAREHKVFNLDTEEHRNFLHSFRQKVESLTARYPFLNLADELAYFSR